MNTPEYIGRESKPNYADYGKGTDNISYKNGVLRLLAPPNTIVAITNKRNQTQVTRPTLADVAARRIDQMPQMFSAKRVCGAPFPVSEAGGPRVGGNGGWRTLSWVRGSDMSGRRKRGYILTMDQSDA
eukprot:5356455-Pyramimonas_sp.AAC.1